MKRQPQKEKPKMKGRQPKRKQDLKKLKRMLKLTKILIQNYNKDLFKLKMKKQPKKLKD